MAFNSFRKSLENFYGIIRFHLTEAEQARGPARRRITRDQYRFWRHRADLCEFLKHVVEQSVLLLSQACGLASQPTWIIAIAPNAAHVYTIPSEPTGHRHRRHRHYRHPIDPKLLGQDDSSRIQLPPIRERGSPLVSSSIR